MMPSSHDLDQDIARLRAQLQKLANEAKQAGCLQDGHHHTDGAPPAAAATKLDAAYQPQVSTGLPIVCMGLRTACLLAAPHNLPLQADVLSSVQKRAPACLTAVPLHVPHTLQTCLLIVQCSTTINAVSALRCAGARCPPSASPSRQMCAATTGSHSYRRPALTSS